VNVGGEEDEAGLSANAGETVSAPVETTAAIAAATSLGTAALPDSV
jgi:hypothetical protein